MKLFKDNEGREWQVAVNVATVKRVRDLTGTDLLTALDGKLFEQLVSDPVLLCDVVYALCKPQADKAGVTDEEFGRGMGGDAIDNAVSALLPELVDFFPSPRRAILKKALEKLRKLEAMTLDAASKALDSDALEKLMKQELDATSIEEFVRRELKKQKSAGGTSTASPGQSESTPVP